MKLTALIIICFTSLLLPCDNSNNYELYSYKLSQHESLDFFVNIELNEAFVYNNNYKIIDKLIDINNTTKFTLQSFNDSMILNVKIYKTNTNKYTIKVNKTKYKNCDLYHSIVGINQ